MNLPIASDPQTINSSTIPLRTEVAISLEKVGVRYKVASERIPTFKEYMIRRFQRKVQMRDFWALEEISITIHKGEVFGLIGPNGAGKSTLLKLIARVLRPTQGRVIARGRVAPLLEFGAGFHQDLTGRENVFLNGALLGFSHEEMRDKFNRIVDFAELWDFIDVPMRNYSTGMWARLGFALATDVEPDILIVDEVLSVGDEAFQRKSFAKMETFREMGATILFVSHSMDAIANMCHRAAWLDHGHLQALGEVHEVINAYRESQMTVVRGNEFA
jgi:ABC-type polysaccharide/polyol phosphate transport system ATPase subunit